MPVFFGPVPCHPYSGVLGWWIPVLTEPGQVHLLCPRNSQQHLLTLGLCSLILWRKFSEQEFLHFCSDMAYGGACVVCSPWPLGAYIPPFFAHLLYFIYLLPAEVVRNIYLKLENAFNCILVFFFFFVIC